MTSWRYDAEKMILTVSDYVFGQFYLSTNCRKRWIHLLTTIEKQIYFAHQEKTPENYMSILTMYRNAALCTEMCASNCKYIHSYNFSVAVETILVNCALMHSLSQNHGYYFWCLWQVLKDTDFEIQWYKLTMCIHTKFSIERVKVYLKSAYICLLIYWFCPQTNAFSCVGLKYT